ncbi:MAG: hypothetical protein J0H49_29475 [Acidobacteria bacterium]|nr:hypothetical protein [Acidobacteriota bacterium]
MTYPALVCLLATLASTSGQSLQVSPASGSPGDSITIEVALVATADPKPSALQWDIIFPAQLLELGKPPVEASSVVRNAGKTLTCAGRNAYTTACILAGGSEAIPNGPIAAIHLKIRAEAKQGTTTVKLGKIQAVTSDLRPLTLKDLDTVITIR